MTFYIWQEPDDSAEQRVTEIRLRGGRAEIVGYRDVKLEALIQDLLARTSLPFLTEYVDSNKRRLIDRVNVGPGEINYEFAFTQALQREGAYLLSFTPNPWRSED